MDYIDLLLLMVTETEPVHIICKNMQNTYDSILVGSNAVQGVSHLIPDACLAHLMAFWTF